MTTVIRLSVFYPTTEGATFGHDYYRNHHVPLAVKTWGLDGAEIDKGVNGPNVAAVHFKFESPVTGGMVTPVLIVAGLTVADTDTDGGVTSLVLGIVGSSTSWASVVEPCSRVQTS